MGDLGIDIYAECRGESGGLSTAVHYFRFPSANHSGFYSNELHDADHLSKTVCA